MDLKSIGKLIATICIHYPSASKHYMNDDGSVKLNVANEWHRCIGYLDYEEAIEKLDVYLKQPEGNKFAPDVKTFMRTANDESGSRKVYHEEKKHDWYVDKWGNLYDEEGRCYADPICTAKYYINEKGNVCQMGMTIYKHGTMLPEGKHKWDYLHADKESEVVDE